MPALCAVAILTTLNSDSGEAVLSKIRNAYAQCRTYRDVGTVKALYKRSGKVEDTQELEFKTVFSRPGNIKFEFRELQPDSSTVFCVFWTTGKRGTYDGHHWPPDKIEWLSEAYYSYNKELESGLPLSLAIASFTGISHGVAHTVPPWLFPEEQIGGRDPLKTGEYKYRGIVPLNGRRCHRFDYPSWNTTMWFESRTHLLLQINEVDDLGEFDGLKDPVIVETTVRFEPQINSVVEQTEFKGPK